MTDETAKAILAHPLEKVLLDKSDADPLARFWLMRDAVVHILTESAEVPISGTDSSCGFCNSYDFDKNGHLTIEGKECPAVVAKRLLAEMHDD